MARPASKDPNNYNLQLQRRHDNTFSAHYAPSTESKSAASLHSAPASYSDSSLLNRGDANFHRGNVLRTSGERLRQRTSSSSSKLVSSNSLHQSAILVEPMELTFYKDDPSTHEVKINIINANNFAVDAKLTPPNPARYQISQGRGLMATSKADIEIKFSNSTFSSLPDMESMELVIVRRSDPKDVIYSTTIPVFFRSREPEPLKIKPPAELRVPQNNTELEYDSMSNYRNIGTLVLASVLLYSMPSPFWDNLGQYFRLICAFLLGYLIQLNLQNNSARQNQREN